MIVYISFFQIEPTGERQNSSAGKEQAHLDLIGPEQKIIWRKTELEYALDPQE